MQSDVAAFSVFMDIYMQRHWPLTKEKKKKVLWQAKKEKKVITPY